MVVALEDVDAADIAGVGGKAVNLGILTAAGFRVPVGFCVTTRAYERAVADRVERLVGELTGADAVTVASRIRETIRASPIPVEVRAAIAEGYRLLGAGPPVAVRSSATAEDLSFASFAGQQDSYLNLIGTDAVVDAVRRCWASLWTDRAVDYRTRNGIDQRTVRLAVVVQRMVQAAAAGVLFTADPVTGTRHHCVIDSSFGLGEAVVSGAVNPDRFVVDAHTGEVLQTRLGDKRLLVRSLDSGGVEQVERTDGAGGASLTDAQLAALVALGQQVQRHYGAPQDIEWALDEHAELWLTQARPVTTLYPLVEPAARPGVRVYLCVSLAQGLTRPITPMGLAAFRLIGTSIATAAGAPPRDPLRGPAVFRVIGQRAFVDFTTVVRHPIARQYVLRVFGVMEARAAAVIRGLTADPRFAVVSSSRWSAARPVLRVILSIGMPRRLLLAAVSPTRAHRAIDEIETKLRRDLEVSADATSEQRLDHVQHLLSTRVFWLMPTVVAYPLAGFAFLGLARKLLGGLAQPGDLQTVLRGLPHNVTTEMDLALWDLAVRVRDDHGGAAMVNEGSVVSLTNQYRGGALPAVLQDGLGAFLIKFGHRSVAEIDCGMPRWSDDPSHLLGVMKNYLRLGDDDRSPSAQFADGNEQAEAMVTSLVARMRGRSRIGARVVAIALRRARRLAGLREKPKFLLVLALAAIRAQIGVVGHALADQGRLAEPDDVFFCDPAEVRRGLAGEDLRSRVREQRAAYALELRRRHIPRLLLSDGTEPEAVTVATERTDGALVGSPASGGRVTGRARVVLDPVGAQLEPGEILVAPSTDPGWTPLFLTAGGLVMEMGGSNSHGAVVAREYGIPAVVGVSGATTRIVSGQLVTVDGAAGVVLSEEGPLGGPPS